MKLIKIQYWNKRKYKDETYRCNCGCLVQIYYVKKRGVWMVKMVSHLDKNAILYDKKKSYQENERIRKGKRFWCKKDLTGGGGGVVIEMVDGCEKCCTKEELKLCSDCRKKERDGTV